MKNHSRIINNYETKNLNKATYLISRGAKYKGCHWDNPKIATIILNNVNMQFRDDFWTNDVPVDLKKFIETRRFIKGRLAMSKSVHNDVK